MTRSLLATIILTVLHVHQTHVILTVVLTIILWFSRGSTRTTLPVLPWLMFIITSIVGVTVST